MAGYPVIMDVALKLWGAPNHTEGHFLLNVALKLQVLSV